MTVVLDDVKRYIAETFATDIEPHDLPDDIDLTATGILTSISTVQLISWCGNTFRIPINTIAIDPAHLKTPLAIAEFIQGHRTDITTEGHHVVR